MVKLEKGKPLTKGQLIILIVLITIAAPVLIRQIAPSSGIDVFVFPLGIVAIIVVGIAKRPPEKTPVKDTPKRTYKDFE